MDKHETEKNTSGLAVDGASTGYKFEDGELDPYFEDGYWRLPYLLNGAGGFGGGVGEMKHETKEGVIKMYKDYHS